MTTNPLRDQIAALRTCNICHKTPQPVDVSGGTDHAHQAPLVSPDAHQPAPDALAEAANLILSQPKRPDSLLAQPFRAACAYLEHQECGAETTTEIIETFLRARASQPTETSK